MSISSLQLDAFNEVVKCRSFSEAAKRLHITQSALSQRILKLESELGATLIIREQAGLKLTEVGRQLHVYCKARNSLEQEFVERLQSRDFNRLAGAVRIAGFSTVMRSLVIPSLEELLRSHPLLHAEFSVAEIRDLPPLLESGQVDYILTNRPVEKEGIESQLLGYEENVLVRPRNKKFTENVFLDHDVDDATTYQFLKIQNRKVPEIRRFYFDEIYAIIDGVVFGYGRAVVPLHLAKQVKGLEVEKSYKPMRTPVYLAWDQQSFYTKLHHAVVDAVSKGGSSLLAKP